MNKYSSTYQDGQNLTAESTLTCDCGWTDYRSYAVPVSHPITYLNFTPEVAGSIEYECPDCGLILTNWISPTIKALEWLLEKATKAGDELTIKAVDRILTVWDRKEVPDEG